MEIIINTLPETMLLPGAISQDTFDEMNRTAILVLNKIAELYDVSLKAEVGLIWTNDEYIRNLNRQYRGIDSPTDVLSFAMNDELDELNLEGEPQILNAPDGLDFSGQEILLGDIIISVETALAQAAEYGHSLTREMAFLTTHGMLHLLGYDHEEEEDTLEMQQEEKYILTLLGIER